jgi:pyruvate-ferredoxin/flavodoxin oxidoreductase
MADGNEAVASVAYRLSEVIAIYPITPASPMGELSDAWAAKGQPNVWSVVPDVVEMQSEAGAAGAVHGALQAGSLATTFTASQGLLLMLPNMYKIAGELTPFVLHVSARTLATHALSIFGDHSDVMSARGTGFAMLASASVQEAHDLAAVSHVATLEGRIPFLHFFDGFRTSHEVNRLEKLSDDELESLVDSEWIHQHRQRALTPDNPQIRGTAQNPDSFFQAREAANSYYDACPGLVQKAMDRYAALTGRQYHLFDYHGHPEAERVAVLMGSGAETCRETVDYLCASGEKVGMVQVRLFRPFSIDSFVAALPPTTRSLAVLDRTKEPGAPADPLFQDVLTALEASAAAPESVRLIGGRYGLGSKEFNPGCVKAIFDELESETPRRRFTVGMVDDVTHLSLDFDPTLDVEPPDRVRALFYGLGSDGTVSANKNSIKIIGEETGQHAQGYFVYDSKKAGAVTISHLRFGKDPIHSTYLVNRADFVACHQWDFLDRFDVAEYARDGATLLLNAPYSADKVWDHLPRELQASILEKELQLHVVDAYRVARESGLGARINTVMQTCFFALSKILPVDEAIAHIKSAIDKTYGGRGPELVERNFKAVDQTLAHLERVEIPAQVTSDRRRPPIVSEEAPDFVQKVTAVMLAGKGDLLPVSAFPIDGTWPVGTTKWEKRNIAAEIPLWDEGVCIQCNQCALVCPHAAIRTKVYEPEALAAAPAEFQSAAYKAGDFKGLSYTVQVAPEDCTGCSLCVEICPAKDRSNPRHKAINMEPQQPVRERERGKYSFFLDLPEVDRSKIKRLDAKGSQFLQPLFEYSGACAGCGETPYVKLLSQLFGDRLLIANATGCSSIYGGNLPTTPYTTNDAGRGPAWANSLFEDNAEFGLGFRLAVDSLGREARALLQGQAGGLDLDPAAILESEQLDEVEIDAQRERVLELRERLAAIDTPEAKRLTVIADYLVRKSVWLLGGDGWAYDIGYGGVDHVLSLRRDVNIMVLDTQVYSNTGGQMSKATPLGAAAKFAVNGKEIPQKDLGMEAMSYGHVFVAQIAFGANMNQAVQAIREAEAHRGPSIIIAYSPCIAHGYDLRYGVDHQKTLVDSGLWPLYRFDPSRLDLGEPPLKLDSKAPKRGVEKLLRAEARFRMIERLDPQRFRNFIAQSQRIAERRRAIYEQLAGISVPAVDSATEVAP